MVYQTFTHQIWLVMVCYDLEHQIRCAKQTFSGRCDIMRMVCCSFGVHNTPQFLQCKHLLNVQIKSFYYLNSLAGDSRERVLLGL